MYIYIYIIITTGYLELPWGAHVSKSLQKSWVVMPRILIDSLASPKNLEDPLSFYITTMLAPKIKSYSCSMNLCNYR